MIIEAMKNAGFYNPLGRKTVNLAPADLPKEGSAFDLPIAIGLLAASRQIRSSRIPESLILGELALDGKLRPVRGVLSMAVEAKKRGLKYVVLPEVNGREAAVVSGIDVVGFKTLSQEIGRASCRGRGYIGK